jgi:hypothetical protein
MRIIDPPSPFHPAADWRAFLREMERLQKAEPADPQLAEQVAAARAHLAEIQAAS